MSYQEPPDPHYPTERFQSRPGHKLSILPLSFGRARIISGDASFIETLW